MPEATAAERLLTATLAYLDALRDADASIKESEHLETHAVGRKPTAKEKREAEARDEQFQRVCDKIDTAIQEMQAAEPAFRAALVGDARLAAVLQQKDEGRVVRILRDRVSSLESDLERLEFESGQRALRRRQKRRDLFEFASESPETWRTIPYRIRHKIMNEESENYLV